MSEKKKKTNRMKEKEKKNKNGRRQKSEKMTTQPFQEGNSYFHENKSDHNAGIN